MTETTPLSGKKIWSSGPSASTRICSRRKGTCSRYGISRLRSREDKASKSLFRGHLDSAFILSQAAGYALVPRRSVSIRGHLRCAQGKSVLRDAPQMGGGAGSCLASTLSGWQGWGGHERLGCLGPL